MTSFEILISLVSISVILLGGFFLLSFIMRSKDKNIVIEKVQEQFPDRQIVYHNEQNVYQMKIETEDEYFLIKVIYFNPNHELIITNPNYWCINQNIKNWKRSATPALVEGVREFQQEIVDTQKKVIKVAIIYPGCYNITRYINESDVELVSYKKSAIGVYFVKFNEIDLFFKN